MMELQGRKQSLVVWIQYANVTDRRTGTGW